MSLALRHGYGWCTDARVVPRVPEPAGAGGLPGGSTPAWPWKSLRRGALAPTFNGFGGGNSDGAPQFANPPAGA